MTASRRGRTTFLASRATRAARLLLTVAAVALAACASEAGRWEKARQADTVATYREYLATYPNGQFAAMARLRVDELELATAEAAGTIAALEAFVAAHRGSPVLARADEGLARLRFAAAQAAGTAEAWAEFLRRHPGSALAAKARAERSGLLFGFRTEVTARRRVTKLSGFLAEWGVREKHVGLVLRVAFDFQAGGGDLKTTELGLAYVVGEAEAESPCAGITLGGQGDKEGVWVFSDLEAGMVLTMKIRNAGRETHSLVFAVPVGARDLVLRFRGEPLTGVYQLSQFPEKAD